MISERMGQITDEGKKHTKAVIANANFVIGGPAVFLGNEAIKGKEVDEWLMGSGDAVTQAFTGCVDETQSTK